MSDQSLTAHVTPISVSAEVIAAAFMGDAIVFALANGDVVFKRGEQETVLHAHPDAVLLFAAADHQRMITGGDDGRVVEIRADGSMQELAHEKGKWIDAVTLRSDGAMAWSIGKNVYARDTKGEIKAMSAPSTVRGLGFMPKGYRLAMAHYNGVSLWFPNIKGETEGLPWAGSHLDLTVSPDGKFVISAMQEHSLHGWRVADKKDMRMTGYPSKTRSFSWSPDGQWLATSGAEACIVWPFQSKDGPMGKGPRECGVRPARVSQVAFHPSAAIVAIGYDDGWVMLCRLGDAAEILVRATSADAPKASITALCWHKNGQELVFGDETGVAGLLKLPNP